MFSPHFSCAAGRQEGSIFVIQIWDFLQFPFQWKNKRGAEPQKPYVTVGHQELKLPANFGNPGDRHLMILSRAEILHDKLWLSPLCSISKISPTSLCARAD
jgi:hypothetical protein